MITGIRSRAYDTATDASSGQFRRGIVSWFGLLLLTFNLVAGAILPVRSVEAGLAPFAQELFSDRIVICTAAGMLVVDRDGKPVDDGGTSSSHNSLCVFCLPLMHSGAAAPAAEASVLVPLVSAAALALSENYRLPVLRQAHNPHPARAPPV